MTVNHDQTNQPDDEAVTEWHRDMQVHSASYRVLNSSGWAMRRLAILLAKVTVLALLLAVAIWLVGNMVR